MNLLAVGAGLVMGALMALPGAVRAQEDPGTAAVAALPSGQDEYWGECARAIAAAEPTSNLPQGLLLAISMVESGRRNPDTRQVQPWPWSWNAGGESGFAETRGEAASVINALLEGGQRSIDVGCMQVNLLHHPDAFVSVEEALDPVTNVAYAIRFLHRLRARNANWAQAVADYHSATPMLGAAYHRRVVAAGRDTGMEGGAIALPARIVTGLCAPGLRPALLMGGPPPRPAARGQGARPALRPAPVVARTRIVCLRTRMTEYAQASAPAPRGRDALPLPPRPAVRPAVANGRDPALLPLPPPAPIRRAPAPHAPRLAAGIKK